MEYRVQFSCWVMSDSLWPHGLQHARLPCPSPTPRPCSNSCTLSRWWHPTISSFVIPLSSAFNLSQHQEYYSAIRKNEILPLKTTWMDLEGIILNEMSDRDWQILYATTYMWNLNIKQMNKYKKIEIDSQKEQTRDYRGDKEGRRSKVGIGN